MEQSIYILIYLAIVTIIGILSKTNKDVHGQYTSFSQKVNLIGSTTSIFATLVTESVIFYSIALTARYGPWGVIAAISGPSIALIVLSFFVPNIYINKEVHKFQSVTEYCSFKWGAVAGRVTKFLFMLLLAWVTILQIKLNATIFSDLLKWPSALSTSIVVLVISFYLLLGGYKSVVRTDIFQTAIIFVIFLLPLFITPRPLLTSYFEKDVSVFNCLLLFLMSFFLTIARPEMWQRIYNAKNVKVAKSSLRISSILFFSLGIFILYYAVSILNVTSGKSDTEAFAEGYKLILPSFLSYFFPVILLAAMMSSLDSATFLLAIEFSSLNGKNSNKGNKKIFWIKLSIVLILLIAGFLSLYVFNLLAFAYKINGIIALIVIPILLSFRFLITKKEFLISFFLGLSIYILQLIAGSINDNPSLAVIPAFISGICLFLLKIIQKNWKVNVQS